MIQSGVWYDVDVDRVGGDRLSIVNSALGVGVLCAEEA